MTTQHVAADVCGMHISYVLVTPARNEEQFIEKAINSVIAQSVLPICWQIVSDGSTDGTDEIVLRYARKYAWIHYHRLGSHPNHNFGAKVHCFNAGYELVRHMPFDIIGNLDADISFGPDYFAFLLGQFVVNGRLGVAGTPFVEPDSKTYNYKFTNIEHVSGACQLFRRDCFEDIGGYKPIAQGGIDWLAVTTARMKGWETRTFVGAACVHHRPMGTAASSISKACFNQGKKDYYFGNHPVWEVGRLLYQTLRKKPYILGSFYILCGYLIAALIYRSRPISSDLVRFVRKEQMERLYKMFGKLFCSRTRAKVKGVQA